MGLYDEEEQQKKAETLRKKRVQREQSDVAKVLSSPEGRRFVWRILTLAGVFAQSFAGESTHQTSFAEGRRSVGNLVLKDIQPEVELTMKREAANDQLLRDQEIAGNAQWEI